jgi:hypothetical protein
MQVMRSTLYSLREETPGQDVYGSIRIHPELVSAGAQLHIEAAHRLRLGSDGSGGKSRHAREPLEILAVLITWLFQAVSGGPKRPPRQQTCLSGYRTHLCSGIANDPQWCSFKFLKHLCWKGGIVLSLSGPNQAGGLLPGHSATCLYWPSLCELE